MPRVSSVTGTGRCLIVAVLMDSPALYAPAVPSVRCKAAVQREHCKQVLVKRLVGGIRVPEECLHDAEAYAQCTIARNT